ncbi:MAG: MFS transporter, partial [Anaerolineales bacterium]
YNPYLYVYIADLGISGKQIGLLASLVPVSMLVFTAPIASLADVKSWRVRILRLGLLGWAVSLFFLQFPNTFAQFVMVLLPLAVLNSPVMAIADGLISRMAKRENLNYGGMRLWGSFGFATSALLFGAVWQKFTFKPMFTVASLLAIPLLWIAGKFNEGEIIQSRERGSLKMLFQDKGLLMLLAAIFLSGVSNSITMTFEGIYARSLGGGNFLIGVMIASAAFFELPAMFYMKKIARVIGRPNTILLGYAFSGAAFLGYILVSNPNYLPFFSVLKGIAYGLTLTGSIALLTERTPDEWSSTSQSLMAVSYMGLAPLVAGPLGGMIHDAYSPGAVFVLGLVTMAGAAIILISAS